MSSTNIDLTVRFGEPYIDNKGPGATERKMIGVRVIETDKSTLPHTNTIWEAKMSASAANEPCVKSMFTSNKCFFKEIK